jgi:hypothetical protein
VLEDEDIQRGDELMRIISQDKRCDIDYDRAILLVQQCNEDDDWHIFASYSTEEDAGLSMGTYETMERALEVMRDIQLEYASNWRIMYRAMGNQREAICNTCFFMSEE